MYFESEISKNLIKLNKDYYDLYYSSEYQQLLSKKSHSTKSRFTIIIETYKKYGLKYLIERIIKRILSMFGIYKNVDFNLQYHSCENKINEEKCIDVGKIAIYTSIFGNYDTINEPMFKSENCDFFIITDQEIKNESIWKKIESDFIPGFSDLDNYHKSKFCKLHPHLLFPDYDYSIWIDGNVQIVGDLYPLITRLKDKEIGMYGNPLHNCIYTEAEYMIQNRRVDKKNVEHQLDYYQYKGFPKKFGMRECSIIVRHHKSKECIEIMKDWWEHLNKFTMRDQLSLPFILYEKGYKIDYIELLGDTWRWNPRFRVVNHINTVEYK